MGQRLVVKVVKDGKDIAGMYFHWSAYSMSALVETRNIINAIYNDESETEDVRLRLIRYCESNGGCINGGADSKEWNRIVEMFPNETFKTDGSRNCGLIALSEDGIDNIHLWSEGDVIIDLDNETVTDWVWNEYESIDDYNEDRKEWMDEDEEIKLEDIIDVGYDLNEFDISEIDNIIHKLNNYDGYVVRNGKNIYELIA